MEPPSEGRINVSGGGDEDIYFFLVGGGCGLTCAHFRLVTSRHADERQKISGIISQVVHIPVLNT